MFGGWINDAYSWRSAFGVQVPFLLVASILIARFIRIPMAEEHKNRSLWQKLKRIDFLGSALLITGIGGLLFSVTALGNPVGLGGAMPSIADKQVWIPGVVSLVSIVAFVMVEAYLVAEPVLPVRLLKIRTPACISAVYFITSCSYYSLYFWYPLYFQAVRGYSASAAGLRIVPLAVASAVGSLGAGLFMKATGKYWWLQTIGAFLPIFFMGQLAFWTPTYPGKVGEYLSIVPAGLGLSAIYTTLLVALMAAVSRAEFGIANGMIYLFRTLGQVIGVGATGAAMQVVLARLLRQRITGPGADKIISDIQHSIASIDSLPPDLQQAARLSYSDALRVVFIICAALNILSFAFCLPIEALSIDPATKAPDADEAAHVQSSNERETAV